jgi:hypothetical protein
MNQFDPDVKLELHIVSTRLHDWLEIYLTCTNRFREPTSLCMWQGDRNAQDSPLPLVLGIAHALLDIPTDRWERVPNTSEILPRLHLSWFDAYQYRFTDTPSMGFKCALPVGEIGCTKLLLYFSHAFRKSELSSAHKMLLDSLLSASLAADNSPGSYPGSTFKILPE